MRYYNKIIGAAVLVIAISLMLLSTSCFGNNTSNNVNGTPTPSASRPKPRIESYTVNTSGTKSSYYATLDIKVKNDGSEGTVLVVGTVTQAGKTNQNQMEVFLKQGESHELKLTYPLVWEGGDFTPDVQAVVP